MVNRARVSNSFILIFGSALLLSCLDDRDAGSDDVSYTILYDVTDKEIDVREACQTAVLALRDQAALDAFIARWSVRSDSLSLPGIDFNSNRILGMVTRRNEKYPTLLKVASFKETDDSLRLSLSTECSICIKDSFSGDVIILSYAATQKPLAITLNGKAKALADSVKAFGPGTECAQSD